MLFLREP